MACIPAAFRGDTSWRGLRFSARAVSGRLARSPARSGLAPRPHRVPLTTSVSGSDTSVPAGRSSRRGGRIFHRLPGNRRGRRRAGRRDIAGGWRCFGGIAIRCQTGSVLAGCLPRSRNRGPRLECRRIQVAAKAAWPAWRQQHVGVDLGDAFGLGLRLGLCRLCPRGLASSGVTVRTTSTSAPTSARASAAATAASAISITSVTAARCPPSVAAPKMAVSDDRHGIRVLADR